MLKVVLMNENRTNIKDYDMNLLKEFILFYKEFDGYENILKESELDLIEIFLGERYE